jgi:TPR repeat protein
MKHSGKYCLYAPLLALVLTSSPAGSQTTTTTTQTPPATGEVVVTGKRKAAEPSVVVAAKSRILSQNSAASCNFLSDYDSNGTDIVTDYMSDFSPGVEYNDTTGAQPQTDSSSQTDGSQSDNSAAPASNPTLRNFSDTSPLGDASNPGLPTTDGFAVNSYCSQSDLTSAAARNYIARKDTKLKEAFEALDAKDYPKALTLFKQAYDKIGYEEAAFNLGRMYLFGLGTPQSTKEAVFWLRKVAEQRFDMSKDSNPFNKNDPEFMTLRTESAVMLARIYMTGFGTPKNPTVARKWYQKAEDFGFIPAKYTVAMMYQNGYGGEKSVPKAFKRLLEAAELGYVPAQYQVGVLYYNGDEGVPQDIPRAGAWFVQAAKGGNAGALYAVGRMYDFGETVPADQQKALIYYKEAAIKGDRDAQNALGTFFYTGEIVPKDLETARKWFDSAAKKGQVDAMFNLGAMYARGEGGPKDLAMAYIWFTLAKASGNENADAALKVLEPKLTDDDIARIDAILKPPAKKAP